MQSIVKAKCETPKSQITTKPPSPSQHPGLSVNTSTEEILCNLVPNRQPSFKEYFLQRNSVRSVKKKFVFSLDNSQLGELLPTPDISSCRSNTLILNSQTKADEQLERRIMQADWQKALKTRKNQENKEIKEHMILSKMSEENFKAFKAQEAKLEAFKQRRTKKEEADALKHAKAQQKFQQFLRSRDDLQREEQKHKQFVLTQEENKQRHKQEQKEARESWMEFIRAKKLRANQQKIIEQHEHHYIEVRNALGELNTASRKARSARRSLDTTMSFFNI